MIMDSVLLLLHFCYKMSIIYHRIILTVYILYLNIYIQILNLIQNIVMSTLRIAKCKVLRNPNSKRHFYR